MRLPVIATESLFPLPAVMAENSPSAGLLKLASISELANNTKNTSLGRHSCAQNYSG